MRKPRRNELWDRTPGGLAIPRRPGLPTKRFIQKLGMTKDCCGGKTCETFCASRPDTIYADFSELDLGGEICTAGECSGAAAIIAADYTSYGGYCSQWTYISPTVFCGSDFLLYKLYLNVVLRCGDVGLPNDFQYEVLYSVWSPAFLGQTRFNYRANLDLGSQSQANLFAAGIVCDYYSSGYDDIYPCTINSYPSTITLHT